MNPVSTIGILGGMGPQATNYFCSLITSLTNATSDQEHIPVITFNNSLIPSRNDALLRGGASPVPELVKTARVLEQAGADFILMPCNTAHCYIDDVVRAVAIPIIDMIQLTLDHIRDTMPHVKTVGILASSATIDTGLYQRPLAQASIVSIAPTAENQHLVMEAIFGKQGIKAGSLTMPRQSLFDVGGSLIASGADVIIAGCTEVSLVLRDQQPPFPFIDPLTLLAQTAVDRALAGWGGHERDIKHPLYSGGR
ncbi:MAG TPA: amino acid racemase [Trichormus sp.]|jgi:aspartate racemase